MWFTTLVLKRRTYSRATSLDDDPQMAEGMKRSPAFGETGLWESGLEKRRGNPTPFSSGLAAAYCRS
jgi:hypothetical protein